ncbi:MAG: aspartate aminotransferase family protein [Akkermansiaceae bacterium]|nr:aspartate aminotransferase family protein [Akkermansiaceae bacterium]
MLPELITEIPGPRSLALADELKRYECRNVTYTAEDWPVFWQRADGVNVWDEDGNRYIDLTAAFGVAGLGHGWSAGVMREQSEKLIHGMGDVHPTALKVEVCKLLSAMTFERWGEGVAKTTLSNSGFEAVETALKTAVMATAKAGLVSFKNGYHGLGYGALLGTGIEKFRTPFEEQLAPLCAQLDFPSTEDDLLRLEQQLGAIEAADVGALLVEPIQGRGGKLVPPDGFLAMLRAWCDCNEVVLIYDEVYSGFNRTGKLFACDWEGVAPDIICLGKSLSGGYPISACVGKSRVMDAWPASEGEALHTSTFLGNPVGCAMAVASLKEHSNDGTRAQVEKVSAKFKELLCELKSPLIKQVRGRGLMLGMELEHADGGCAGDVAGQVLSDMMQQGVFMLADGAEGNVLAFTPPFIINDEEIEFAMEQLQCALDR